MTRTKAWRLSLAAILGFGWLFLTPAYSDDPLGIAAQQIDQLEADVQKLNDKAATQALIDIANSKYDAAVIAKSNMDAKQAIMETKNSEYNDALTAQANALSQKNTAQLAVDNQTPIVTTANTNKQTKKDNLDSAQTAYNAQLSYVNSQITYSYGLNMFVYDCSTSNNSFNESPALACGGEQPVLTSVDANGIDEQWDNGGPLIPGAPTNTTTTENFNNNQLNTALQIKINGTNISTTVNNGAKISAIGWPNGINGSDPVLWLQNTTAPVVMHFPNNTKTVSFYVFAKNGDNNATITYSDGTTEVLVIQHNVSSQYPNYVHQEIVEAPSNKYISTISIATDWDYWAIDTVFYTVQTSSSSVILDDDFQVKWTGKWWPTHTGTMWITAPADDGVILKLNGLTVIDDWVDKGGGGSTATISTTAGVPMVFEMWYYENGGGAWVQLSKYTNNGWVVIPGFEFKEQTGNASQASLDDLNQKQLDLQTAQSQYDSALAAYNTENSKLTQYQQTLNSRTTAYNTAVTDRQTAQTSLNTATTNYNNAVINYNTALSELNNSIVDAQNEYNKQWDFEEKQRVAAAIAQAMANQPQPTPEPSVEPTPEITVTPGPSPEPTPEQTQPSDPTPEPSPETTPLEEPTPSPEPSPTVEPSPEPSPQPTDTNPTPTPQPTSNPVVVPDKTINTPVSEEMANLLADLTNSNTLAKLTPEQKVAVAGTLGIRATEIAKIAELAKSEPTIAKALEEFGNRANENLKAPMPYTLADATTEIATEQLLSDPIGALTSIDLSNIDFGNLGADMTDDQREKAQEVIIPVVIASNIVAAAMTRRK